MSTPGGELFRDLSENAGLLFYRMSLPDGRYDYVSAGSLPLTGYSPEEYYARPLLVRELVHPDGRADFEKAWERLLAGERAACEYTIVDRAGRPRRLRQQSILVRDADGRPRAIEAVVCELDAETAPHELDSARARASELEAANRRLLDETAALQEQLTEARRDRALLTRLTDHLPAAISCVDARERYRFNNQTYQTWFGLPPTQIAGKTVREIVGAAGYALIEDKLRSALRGEIVTFEASIPFERGGTRYVRTSFVPEWDEAHERVLGAFVLASDITGSKKAEADEKRHLLELAHAARLASLGEIASEITHELAQPLAAVVNYSAVCDRLLDSGDVVEIRRVAARLGEQARRALQVMDDFRGFVQKGQPQRRIVNLEEIAARAVDLTRWEAKARTVRLEVRGPLPPVEVDATLIGQVILNLVHNAFDVMADRPKSEPITVRLGVSDGFVEVAVRDGGKGLPDEIKTRLFEPFFTTKPAGLGLGLVLSRRIVESHGGRIWAEDTPGETGATFLFTLPVQPM